MSERFDDLELRQRIIDFVYHPHYRPSKPKGISRALDVAEDDFRAFRKLIKRLVLDGVVTYGSNHLVMPIEGGGAHGGGLQRAATKADKTAAAQADSPQAETAKAESRGGRRAGGVGDSDKFVRGKYRQASAGFGFVRPLPGTKLDFTEDIFVPSDSTESAMDSDLVEVRLRPSRRGGGFEGVVVKVIERARRQFSGSYDVREGQNVVYLDGVKVGSPVTVGDVRGLPVEPGDKVVIELVQFPDGVRMGEGVIMEVLGSSKNPAVDTLAVMHQFGLLEQFPEEVIEQAREQADAFVEGTIPEGRRDLTAVPTLTIDPFDARDFDDAISLSRNDKGHWELMVHIADVAHFVPIGTPLDEEARRRATSVYLPDRVIPMLPELISNHMASLQPDRIRYTKTVFMEMTEEATLVHWEVFNSAILNQQRLNYEQVDQYLADPEAWRERLKPAIWQLIGDMHKLAMVLRKNRMQNGSLELFLPEIKLDLDRSGKVKGARLVENTESHQVIEEFMLAANQAVAKWLDDMEIPFLRRAHAAPDPRKLRKLTEFVNDLGIKVESMESRFEIQKVLRQVRTKPTEYAVNFAVLKSMSKAVYQPEFEEHYALHFDHYCHFTSPIRRYPDLQVHRTVQRILDGHQSPGDPFPVLIGLGQHCSDQEQNAESAEREIIKIKLLHYLSKQLGETMPGVISGVVPEGFYVRGKQIPAEGFVPIASLPEDRYRFERRGHVLEGFRAGHRFRLGDEVVVRIDQIDLARRALLMSVVENLTAGLPTHHKVAGGEGSERRLKSKAKHAPHKHKPPPKRRRR